MRSGTPWHRAGVPELVSNTAEYRALFGFGEDEESLSAAPLDGRGYAIFSGTQEAMAVMAAIVGVCANVAGLAFSYHFDSPTGPTIVCVVAFLFVALNMVNAVIRRTSRQLSNGQSVA